MGRERELLEFWFNPSKFSEKANHLFYTSTLKQIKISTNKLNHIIDSFNPYTYAETESIRETCIKFKRFAPQGLNSLRKEFNTSRYIRRLSWSLDYSEEKITPILNSKYFDFALKLIEANFRPSMLYPLFMLLLRNWFHPKAQQIRNFIRSQIALVKSKRPEIKALKEKSQYYLKQDGTTHLSAFLVNNSKNLIDMFDYLELPTTTITFDYFSEIAEIFTKSIVLKGGFLKQIDGIFSFLEKHNNRMTFKKCLEKIIRTADKLGVDEFTRMKIINYCYKNIGDPAYLSYWHPSTGANNKDKENLNNARLILLNWLARKFLKLFFENIAMDKDRKSFWSNYINFIQNFRIYMDIYDMKMLKNNLTEFDTSIIRDKLGVLEYSSGTSAFVFEIKDYVIVEFSRVGGACYIYQKSNSDCPDLNRNGYEILDLKSVNNRQLAVSANYGYYQSFFNFNGEGRILHNSGWQTRFSSWIEKYLGL